FGTEHPENPRNRLAYAGCLSVTSYLGYSGRFYATSWRNGRCLSAGHWCITCGTRCNIGHFTYLYSTIVHALSPQYFIISFSVGFSNCNSDRTGGNRKGHDRDNSCLHFYVGGWLHPWLGPTVDNDHDYQAVPRTWRSPALALRLMGNRIGQVVLPIAASAVAG